MCGGGGDTRRPSESEKERTKWSDGAKDDWYFIDINKYIYNLMKQKLYIWSLK